jgi:predicted nuclease of predicted toxin-antitoxin system
MRFLVDAQLPPALARMLTSEDFYAEHVYDIGLGNAGDNAIWQYAKQVQATIITKDEDFIFLANLYSDSPSIIWIRLGNTSKQALLDWFKPLLPTIIAALENGDKLIELVKSQ